MDVKQDTPLENAVRMLDLKLETLDPNQTSRWTAPQKHAIHRMAVKVVTEFYKERGN